ncbi:MAG: exodeoxyribonuclease VII small subunit, partial [Phycisphaerales bacterium]
DYFVFSENKVIVAVEKQRVRGRIPGADFARGYECLPYPELRLSAAIRGLPKCGDRGLPPRGYWNHWAARRLSLVRGRRYTGVMGAKKQETTEQAALTFEQAMAQLERIIHDIETGEVGLEESITRYEQGAKLISHCRSVLDRAEKKIRELGVTGDGDLEEEPNTNDE